MPLVKKIIRAYNYLFDFSASHTEQQVWESFLQRALAKSVTEQEFAQVAGQMLVQENPYGLSNSTYLTQVATLSSLLDYQKGRLL